MKNTALMRIVNSTGQRGEELRRLTTCDWRFET